MKPARPNRGGRVKRSGSMDGHGATISTIPAGAAGVWDVDERGRTIRPKGLKKRDRSSRIGSQAHRNKPRSEELPPTEKQLELYARLDTDQPISLTEMGETLGISPGSVRSRLDGLKRKGMVKRVGESGSRHGWLKIESTNGGTE